MNPSFRERLMSILHKTGYEMEHEILAEEACAEILKAVRSIVPPESDVVRMLADSESERWHIAGWNDCRKAILNEIGEGDE